MQNAHIVLRMVEDKEQRSVLGNMLLNPNALLSVLYYGHWYEKLNDPVGIGVVGIQHYVIDETDAKS